MNLGLDEETIYLLKEGILKSHIHVLSDNDMAKAYWSNRSWEKRTDIEVFSYINAENPNT